MASTSKKGFYGDDKPENRFLGPKGEKYFTLVNEKTGKTELWNEEIGQDRFVGEYDPETKKFKPEPTAGLLGKGSRKYEQEFFTSQKGKRLISQNSAKVVEKDLIAEGKSPDDAMIEAAELTKESTRLVKSELSNELKKGGKDKQGTRRDFGNMVYPETIRQSEQDVIKFTILKYQPKGFKARESSLDFFGERNIMKGRKPVGTVVLPIPGGIGDSNSCDWGENSMTAMQAAIANIGLSFLTGTDLAAQITGTAQGVQNNKDDIKEALSNSIVEAATGGQGGALLSRTKGVIMNPNMELLFKKPQLRPFTFTFKLAPRSRKEAISVINIIRTFKQSMAPIRSESNLFLRTPHTYRLQYMSRGKVHPYLNMFKECALTNLNMKYTPDGNYATYEDGVMTAYEMTMQFKELEPVFNDDYEMSSSSTIGQDTDLDWDSSNQGAGKMSTKIGY
tara:strand:- start:866 stop:2212 length:1347 start_codon:yes stop_codon:yes gene_type:complete